MSAGNPLYAAMDTIYASAPGQSAGRWLEGVLRAVAALAPQHLGGVAYAYDIAGDAQRWSISRPVTSEVDPALADGVLASFTQAPSEYRRNLFASLAPAGTYSESMRHLLTEQHETGAQVASTLGVRDAMYINAFNPDGRGVLLALNLAEPTRLQPAARHRLAQLSAHIAAAQRLVAGPMKIGAMLSPSGKVAHAEPGAVRHLSWLRERVRHLEQARADGDADALLDAWSALVRGEYSLVDRFESDGRRFVVAIANPPGLRDPRGLTAREAAIASWIARGHAHKLVAYELGVGVGTIGATLVRVYAKLGVSTRIGLIERLAAPCWWSETQQDRSRLLMFSAPVERVPTLHGLPTAEREVVEAILKGRSNAAIARQRVTSERTVKNQLASVFRKLGVNSRGELVASLTREAGSDRVAQERSIQRSLHQPDPTSGD